MMPFYGNADFFCFDGREVMLLDTTLGSYSLEDGVPAFPLLVFHFICLNTAFRFLDNSHERDALLALQVDFPPRLFDRRMRGPSRGEIIIVGEIAYSVVVAPTVFCGLALGEVVFDDGGITFRDGFRRPFMPPDLADLAKRFDGIIVHQALTIGGNIEDEVAISFIIGTDILLDKPTNTLESVCRHRLLPEPSALDTQASKSRKAVLAGAYLLSCTLLIRLDVGVEECLARILGCIQVHNKTIGLQTLDVVVNLLERDFIVRYARPRSVPTIDDECRNIAIIGEKLFQLSLDELGMLRFDVPRTDAVVGVEDAEIQHHSKSFLAKSINILANHIDMSWRLKGIVVGRLRVPNAETTMMLSRETSIGHACRLGSPCPLMAVEICRSESRHRHIGIGPVLDGIGGHVVMDEHAETQIDKGLLQLAQRLLLSCRQQGCQQEGKEEKYSFHTFIFIMLYESFPNNYSDVCDLLV